MPRAQSVERRPAVSAHAEDRQLTNVSNTHPDYVFWDGLSERETTVKSWNRVFKKLFAKADPPMVGGHPHRFRDTFAASLLLQGVELSHVSILLGHTSIKVTERHYAPWVKARQEQLEADVRRTWRKAVAPGSTGTSPLTVLGV